MSDLIDDEGVVHEKGWDGQYRPRQGLLGPVKDTNLFGQPNVERDFLGNPRVERNWLGQPIQSARGKSLFRGLESSGGGAGSGGGEDALVWLVLAALGFVFYLAFLIIKFFFNFIVKGFKALFSGEFLKALLYFAIPVGTGLVILAGIWYAQIGRASTVLQDYVHSQTIIIAENPQNAVQITRLGGGIESFEGCGSLCEQYVFGRYEIAHTAEATRIRLEVRHCPFLPNSQQVVDLVPGQKVQFYCPETAKTADSSFIYSPPCVAIHKVGDHVPATPVQICAAKQSITASPRLAALVRSPTPSPSPTISPSRTVVVVPNSVHLRAGPGTNFRVVGFASQGDSLPYYGENDDGSWLQVDAAGKTWIKASLVRFFVDPSSITPVPTPLPEGLAVVVPSSVFLRAGPGTDYGVVGYAYKGDQLPVYGRSEDGLWLHIDSGGRTWIATSIVEFGGEITALPLSPTATNTPQP